MNFILFELNNFLDSINTHDKAVCHKAAISLYRSLCSTMDSALRRRHFDRNFLHFEFVEKRLVVESVNVASGSPIFDMEFQFSLHSLFPCNIVHFRVGNQL